MSEPEVKRRRIIRKVVKRASEPRPEEEDTQEPDLGFSDPELDALLEEAEIEKDLGHSEPIEETTKRLVRRTGRGVEVVAADPGFDLYPLNAPGMPLPGDDLVDLAMHLEADVQFEGKGKNRKLVGHDSILEGLMRQLLYSAGDVHLPITIKGTQCKRLAVVTGHKWGPQYDVTGPVRARVMVIGKCLGEEEKTNGRQYIGPTGQLLRDTCDALGIQGVDEWYMTNLLKTEHPLASTGGSTLRKPWVKEWLPILHQELRIVQPDYILCLGADAADALLTGSNQPPGVRTLDNDGREAFPNKKKATIKGMEGRVVTLSYPISRTESPGGAIKRHSALVMAITHPAAVLRAPEQTDVFENGLARFGQLVEGNRPDKEEEGLDHRQIESVEELKDLYYEIKADIEDNLLAVDAEWHGDHPQNEGAYLRTIQLSWKHKTAVCIHVRFKGGKWRFQGGRKALVYWLNKIFRGRRIAGQFFNADLEWLLHLGLKIPFRVAKTWQSCMKQALRKVNPQGGFDTGLAGHAINETGDFGLTSFTLRYTSAPRYDVDLVRWRDDYCNQHKLKKEDLEGYGECPDEILVPYGCYDVDVTRRLVYRFQRLLTKDAYGNNCWEAFWINMRAQPAALEINMTGVEIDRQRLDDLTGAYMVARDELADKLRRWARWPSFKLSSVQHVREFLFGEALNGKERPNPDDPPIRLRPKPGTPCGFCEEGKVRKDGKLKKCELCGGTGVNKSGGRSLFLQPISTTDKRPMRWEEVIEKGLENEKQPSTNKLNLSILAQENQAVRRWSARYNEYRTYDLSEQVTWLRDWRFVGQVLKSVLRPPLVDEEDADYLTDEDGHYMYGGGLPATICFDGRVRTHIYQTKETGRWSSARPPLQNISKKREADYKRILGNNYLYPIRTVIKAPPGCCLVEADYSGAELYGMAIMSGDPAMIRDYESGADIHSQVAVMAFNLDCAPTKVGLRSVPNPRNPLDPDGCEFLRIVAKSVIFGIAYGRGAKAISLAAKEEGINISPDDAQRVIDAIFRLYPRLVPFFQECRDRTVDPRWLCNCFGRFRRFQTSRDWATMGDFERQAMNFPIQSMIADAVSRACDFLFTYREEHPDVDYKFALQIHDAVLLQVPYAHVERVMTEVLPFCMVDQVPIYPTHLDGMPNNTGPYKLAVECEPYLWWGELMTPAQHLATGVPVELSHWKEVPGGYVHKNYRNKEGLWHRWVGTAEGGDFVDYVAL